MDRVKRPERMCGPHGGGRLDGVRRPAAGSSSRLWLSTLMIGASLRFATAGGADEIRRVMSAATYASGIELVEVRRFEEETIREAHLPDRRAEMERFWLAVLAHARGPEALRLACGQLALCGGEDSLPTLATLLGREGQPSLAAMGLFGIPGNGPVEVMIAALPVLAPAERVQVLDSLGRRGDVRGAGAVATWCEHPDATIAVAAIRALGRIVDGASQPMLDAARNDLRPQVRAEAEASLLQMAQRELRAGRRGSARAILESVAGSATPHVRRGAFALQMQCDADLGLARSLRVLTASSPDPVLAPVAIAALPSFAGRGVADRFASIWTNLPPELQPSLADAFARRTLDRGDERSRRALVRAMWWEPTTLREGAILALGRCGGAEEVGPLWERWLTGGEAERNLAVRALVSLPADPATDREIVKRFETAAPLQRSTLADVLARRGGETARSVLLAATRDPDPAVARIAFRAAGTLAEVEDLPALLDSFSRVSGSPKLQTEAETAVARAVARAGTGAGSELRARWSRAVEPTWKASLLTLMPRAGDRELFPVVVAALQDDMGVVRSAALRALASWPGAEAWAVLLKTAHDVHDPAERSAVFAGLVRLARAPGEGAPPVAARVRELWTACRTHEERRAALSVAAEAPSPDTLAVALDALSVSEVRAEARVAVDRIAAAIASTHPDMAAAARRRLDAETP